MVSRRLKLIRVVISLVFFVLIGLLFLDYHNFGFQVFAKEILYLQFIPSLLNFVSVLSLSTIGFAFVLLLTLLFGRVYCSTICPLGTLQDVIGNLARRKQKHSCFQWTSPHNKLRYTILILTILFFLAGSTFLINLLDPFSSFGRILSNLIRPIVLGINNGIAIVLGWFDIHLLYQVQWSVIAPLSIGISIATFLLVIYLSFKHGRLYCNTICPVGALLGLISKASVYKIAFAPDVCKECKRCELVCKANCINSKKQVIDFSRCIGCFNCFKVCKKQGLYFEERWRKMKPKPRKKNGRRAFITSSTMWLVGLTSGAFAQTNPIVQNKPTTIPVPLTDPVTPPGSVSIAQFCSKCTACHLCVSVCPSRVLVPSFLEYGISGMMQPKMSFKNGHCNYECIDCLDICPSGAIQPLGLEVKKVTQLGVAIFIKENCVVYTDNTNCGACSEHCPTKAVDMVHYLTLPDKELVIPEINPDICVGCGGCEYACPTKPYKSIYVEANTIHKIAKKPKEKKLAPEKRGDSEFPF